MTEYFDPTRGYILKEAPGPQLPVVPKKETWTRTENPETIRKLFRFKTSVQQVNFLEDVIQMQDAMEHHGKMLVEKNAVLVQVSTEILQRVTDLDVEWAAKVDEIYEDDTSI